MGMNELFERAAGFPVQEFDLVQLGFYLNVGDEKDTLSLIKEMSEGYESPEDAEVGFIVVWHALKG